MSQTNSQVVEIVVFKVKPERVDDYLSKLEVLHNVVKKFKGFCSLVTHRSVEHPNHFTDYCTWNSLEEARVANELAMKTPELAPLFEMGDGGIISFDHSYVVRSTDA